MPTTGATTAASRETTAGTAEAGTSADPSDLLARNTSITTGMMRSSPIGRTAPATTPAAAAHHHRPVRMARNVTVVQSNRAPSAYPITRVKAGGARASSHTLR